MRKSHRQIDREIHLQIYVYKSLIQINWYLKKIIDTLKVCV